MQAVCALPLITGSELIVVTNRKISGVVVGCDPSARLHISNTLGAYSRSLYALHVLRAHGLPPAALQEVARTTTLAWLLCASPACWPKQPVWPGEATHQPKFSEPKVHDLFMMIWPRKRRDPNPG